MLDALKDCIIKQQVCELMGRMTGETTRLTDSYIQDLYKKQGEWITVVDHYATINANRMLLEKIIRRMQNEHPSDEISVDMHRNRIRLITCQHDNLLSELPQIISNNMQIMEKIQKKANDIKEDIKPLDEYCNKYEKEFHPNWTMRTGKEIALSDMTDDHLEDALLWFKKESPDDDKWISAIENEIHYRDCKEKSNALREKLSKLYINTIFDHVSD